MALPLSRAKRHKLQYVRPAQREPGRQPRFLSKRFHRRSP